MKILNLGFAKSGTTSLRLALEELGFRAHHEWKEAEASWQNCRFADLLEQYDAITEIPANFWLEVAKQFPDAKFLFTYRDMEDWITSRMIHTLYNRITQEEDWHNIDTRGMTQFYELHTERVANCFKGKPNFLRINICGGEGWEILCPFLGAEVPNKPFPKSNTSKERIRRICQHFGC